MPVNSMHPTYKSKALAWVRLRDCYEGEDAVKAAGEAYLPRLSGQESGGNEYESYKARATFFPAVQKTVDGLVGGVYRIEPKGDLPDEKWNEDATLTGLSFLQFTKEVTEEVILTAKVGVLVDFSEEEKRPFASIYQAENIINWGPGWVVLRECIFEPKPDDPYLQVETEQYRELRRTDNGVAVTVWVMEGTGNVRVPKQKGQTRTITLPGGTPPDDIPFVVIRPSGDKYKEATPPLLGMANVNLSHYRTSADLEHGRHLTGLPTPWVADDALFNKAQNDPNVKLPLGSASAWVLNTGANCGFLEFSGQGLGALKEGLEEKAEQMASLGAQMILTQRKQVETAETARIHASGQTSILANIVTGVEQGIEAVQGWFLSLGNRNGKPKFEMNREFVEVTMDPAAATALFQIFQGGGISQETFLWNIQKGQLLPPDRTIEDEMALVEEDNSRLKPLEPMQGQPAGVQIPGGQKATPGGQGQKPGKAAQKGSTKASLTPGEGGGKNQGSAT